MKHIYYIIKNQTEEDVTLHLAMSDGRTRTEVFRAREACGGLTEHVANMFRRLDPTGKVFIIQRVEEEVRPEWASEGF